MGTRRRVEWNVMDITDFSLQKKTTRKNNPLLLNSLRGLIVGKSNCGKTVLLLNLLLKEGWLDYNNLLVFGNSLHQEEYNIIKHGYENKLGKEQILNIFQNQHMFQDTTPIEVIETYDGYKQGGVTAHFYENCDLIPDPKALDPKLKNLLILDDCYLGKQNKAESYYTRGRHNNCDVLYITQNYFALPRGSVRENSNFIILFHQNNKSIEHIYRDHCTDITYEEFKTLCDTVWSMKHNFVTIDLSSSPCNGKYRQNLDTFYFPKDIKYQN